MTDPKQQIGRLALREEGAYWNAYYAEADTMKDALLLGSLHMALAHMPKHKAAFMTLMRAVVSGMLADAVGTKPTWKRARVAPEHERGGHV